MNNPLNNLPPFQIGETVVYITGISMPKDSKHVVSDVRLMGCGCWVIGIDGGRVSVRKLAKGYEAGKCPECGNKYNVDLYDSGGWDPKSFRRFQQSKFPLMSFTSIKEKEEKQILIEN